MSGAVIERLLEAVKRSERSVAFTVIEGEPLGAKALVLESGETVGDGLQALHRHRLACSGERLPASAVTRIVCVPF